MVPSETYSWEIVILPFMLSLRTTSTSFTNWSNFNTFNSITAFSLVILRNCYHLLVLWTMSTPSWNWMCTNSYRSKISMFYKILHNYYEIDVAIYMYSLLNICMRINLVSNLKYTANLPRRNEAEFIKYISLQTVNFIRVYQILV